VNDKKNNLLILLLFLVISSIWIAPVILNFKDFLFHPNAQFSDVLVSHWPNAKFVRDSLHAWNEFPLWNPLILSGAPLVGDPLFGIWYPPNWLSYLLPIGVAINLSFWFHLTWVGLGMYHWMRAEGFHWGGALAAGIACSGMPKLVGHIGLGHLGLVSSIAWTPWLLLVTRRLVFSLSSPRKVSIRWFALGGAVAGVIFVADPRWVLPAAGLAILYAFRVYQLERPTRRIFSSAGIISTVVGGLIFIGTISGLAIPMMEFTYRSTRLDLSVDELTRISLPLKDIIGVFIPQYGAWPETITFAGLVVLGLALIALVGRARNSLFWFSIGIGSLLLALGNQTPVYSILLKILPVANILRVPARFSFLSFFSLFTLAGSGLDLIIHGGLTLDNKRWIRLGIVGLGSLLLLMSFGSLLLLDDANLELRISCLHMILGAILIVVLGFYSLRDGIRERKLISLWVIPIILDLFLMNRSLLEIRPGEGLFGTHAEIASVLHSSSDQYRIFSPSYSIPQNIGVVEGFQLADGVNPLQLKAYWEFMAQTVGFDPVGYSVTLPPFPDGNPRSPLYQNIDPVGLGLLNVGYVVSAYPLSISGLEELKEIDGAYIYWNSDIRPRAWIESGSENSSDNWRDVEEIDWSPNHIIIEAEGSGLLVLSEIAYPGWEAVVDGNEVDIAVYKNILRAIVLDQGAHHIEFYYRPLSVGIGIILTSLALILLLLLWLRR
jgi:hypothetical protein